MRFILLLFTTLMVAFAQADSTSNVKVGVKQGGNLLYIKSGGSFEVDGVNAFQVNLGAIDISTTTRNANKAHKLAPYDATVSSVVCSTTDIPDKAIVVKAKINGVVITNGSVGIGSTSAAFVEYSATPTAANTVTVYDTLSIDVDPQGGVDAAAGVSCTLFLTP